MNINIADEQSQSCSEYVCCFFGYGFLSVILTSTRYDFNTLIDHILVRLSNDGIRAGVLDYVITDYYMMFLCFGSKESHCGKNNVCTTSDKKIVDSN